MQLLSFIHQHDEDNNIINNKNNCNQCEHLLNLKLLKMLHLNEKIIKRFRKELSNIEDSRFKI